MLTISVIIVTKNRPNKILSCLNAINSSYYQNKEIILLDQSDDDKTEIEINKLKRPYIRYYKLNYTGKSEGLNYGIRKAKGKVLAFTDDDCIVSKGWLKNINTLFKSNQKVSAVFGRSLPFLPNKNNGYICPSCLTYNKRVLFSAPPLYRFGFLGNNMAIRKDILQKVGMFKTWLGVGSESYATEDEEMAFRILLNKQQILFEPKLVIYHNRWLTKKEYNTVLSKYTTGFFATFTYYGIKGNIIAVWYLIVNFLNNLDWLKQCVILFFTGHFLSAILYLQHGISFVRNMQFNIHGTFIGFKYAIKDILTEYP